MNTTSNTLCWLIDSSQGLDHFLAKERERTKDRRMMTEEVDSMADQSIDIDDLKSRITKIKEYL